MLCSQIDVAHMKWGYHPDAYKTPPPAALPVVTKRRESPLPAEKKPPPAFAVTAIPKTKPLYSQSDPVAVASLPKLHPAAAPVKSEKAAHVADVDKKPAVKLSLRDDIAKALGELDDTPPVRRASVKKTAALPPPAVAVITEPAPVEAIEQQKPKRKASVKVAVEQSRRQSYEAMEKALAAQKQVHIHT